MSRIPERVVIPFHKITTRHMKANFKNNLQGLMATYSALYDKNDSSINSGETKREYIARKMEEFRQEIDQYFNKTG